jgi:hypothetical protein
MRKSALLKRAAAIAALSATLAVPGVVGLTTGTASAITRCEAAFDSGARAAENYNTAINAGQTSEANFWLAEFRNAQRAYRRLGCS